jgi:hypothetical protein
MLAFPLAQTQAHLKQHHSSMNENLHMLAFPLAKEQAHLKQYHSTIKES